MRQLGNDCLVSRDIDRLWRREDQRKVEDELIAGIVGRLQTDRIGQDQTRRTGWWSEGDQVATKRLVRYQENPKENWGPMRKAKGTA